MRGGRKPIRKGVNFEYRVKKYLESLPEVARVIRNPRSQFPDLFAIQRGTATTTAIECKIHGKLSQEEKGKARILIKDGIPFKVAFKKNHKIEFHDGDL